jgi:hypothetical protein
MLRDAAQKRIRSRSGTGCSKQPIPDKQNHRISMARLPKKPLAGFDPFSQSQTLFLPSPGTVGILVTRRRGRQSAKPMHFPGSHAALTWCEEHRAAFVYFFNRPQN